MTGNVSSDAQGNVFINYSAIPDWITTRNSIIDAELHVHHTIFWASLCVSQITLIGYIGGWLHFSTQTKQTLVIPRLVTQQVIL